MKALKILGTVVLVILALFFIIPLFLADHVAVSASQLIKAKPVTVFHQVNTLENWKGWSPFDDDSAMAVSYEGAKSGVGAKMVWSGKESGTLTVLESRPYKTIITDIVYGQDGTTNGIWQFEETPEGVMVTWTTDMRAMSYPLERWFGLAMEGMMKPMLTKGLNDLKTLAEGMPVPPEISLLELKPQAALAIYDSATLDGIGDLLTKNYGKLMSYIMKKKIPIAGKPFAVYHNWDPAGFIRISAGVPVEKAPKKLKAPITYFELPGGKALFSRHVGGYNTENTHQAIDTYLRDFNLTPKDYIWEVYVTDPATEPDSAKWETDIYYPLK
ncbi:MAG: SRPBCC family protein [Bacteroidales bacterium]|nr:SRPBCC family protein [Bacteroidales bacterium]